MPNCYLVLKSKLSMKLYDILILKLEGDKCTCIFTYMI